MGRGQFLHKLDIKAMCNYIAFLKIHVIYGVINIKSRLSCSQPDQYKQLFSLVEKIQTTNANNIYKMTGCMAACEIDKYIMSKPASSGRLTHEHLRYRLVFETGLLTSKKQLPGTLCVQC
jgi:hypothetical protein